MPLFLKFADIEGPYEVAGVDDQMFSIDSYSQSLFLPVSEGGAHSRIIGTPNVSELMVTKKVDSSTALLMQALCENKQLTEVILYDCATAGDSTEPTPVVKVTMESATIASLSYSGANEVEATQALGLRFDKITWEIGSVDRVSGEVETPKMYEWSAAQAGVRS